MSETVLIIITLVTMLCVLLISLVPFVPGPVLVWSIGVVFAVVNDFERVGLIPLAFMTAFMLIGSTSDLWLRYFGLQRRGGSCWGALGSLVGGLTGTILIPIPIVGTLIGAIGGALLVEYMRMGELEHAFNAGRSVLEMYVLNILVEIGMSILIVVTFLISLWFTA